MCAEKFKANFEKTKGGCCVDDDEFFHVTCHLDANLKDKIAQGEFVDLERLLPKSVKMVHANEDRRVQLVQRDGEMYFAPVTDKDSRIGGIRKWEQAFRVYAAVYCQAYPGRSSKIWQYVHIINSAAAFYVWENVAEYDFVFCHLMAQNPERSWAKTYAQMWNIALREPIQKGKYSSGSNFGSSSQSGGTSRTGNWRDRCCWKYNKNRCNDVSCHYDHRCTYCGGWGHGAFECRKKKRDNNGREQQLQQPQGQASPKRRN